MSAKGTARSVSSFDMSALVAVFELLPRPYLVLDTHFNIVAQNAEHAAATRTASTRTVGRALFEVFPDNPDDYDADGVSKLRSSLLRVLNTRQADLMDIQKYDVQRSVADGGGFETRYWCVLNLPVLGNDGYVQWILNCPEDVTEATVSRKRNALG